LPCETDDALQQFFLKKLASGLGGSRKKFSGHSKKGPKKFFRTKTSSIKGKKFFFGHTPVQLLRHNN
jgi:hypothetical protein